MDVDGTRVALGAENSDGCVGIVRIFDCDGTRRMADRATPAQIGHVFAGVTWAGQASAPTRRNSTASEEVNRAISDLRFGKWRFRRQRRSLKGFFLFGFLAIFFELFGSDSIGVLN